MRIVVVGGTGNFGARICRSLAADAQHEIIATGRSESSRGTPPCTLGVRTATLDILSPNFRTDFAKLRPELVVHCAGPFQGQDYRVAEAACALGAHYVDLSDGRDFVAGFAKHLDIRARSAGICAVSGASSVPALSSAVVDKLSAGFSRMDCISVAIAPGQQAPRGVATLKAVFSYAGAPIPRWEDGSWREAYGWQDLRTMMFPGLGTRLAAACDVPDLALFPQRYPSVRTVEFHAALELRIQHAVLWLAGALRRHGLAVPLARGARLLDRMSTMLLDRFGSENGGMRVSVSGVRPDGTPGQSIWHLTAPHKNGPEVPCMSALLVTRKMLAGPPPFLGARACMGLLDLAEFEPLFRQWGISTSVEEQ
ncbi:NAD-dependent epimerase/dehydratase family protein [Cupriavidus sp. 2TAF22]|uniref:saccharopine dehydrogenase family protein n=1 Tax=unclassified Cupriavidus TaxID=2640874 RepID=UPI003F90BF12